VGKPKSITDVKGSRILRKDSSKAGSRRYNELLLCCAEDVTIKLYKARRRLWAGRDLDKNSFESKSAGLL
jgi:hypothetical protein